MALTTVDKTILGIMDRLEYISKAAAYSGTGGTDFWARIDASGDESFENYMKGFDATGLDDAIIAMNLGNDPYVKRNLNNLKDYVSSSAGGSHATIDAWFTAKRVRVNYRCKALFTSNGMSLSLANVAGDADGGATAPGTACGSLVRGGSLTAGTAIASALASQSPLCARVTAIGSADWTLSVTATLADATTKVLTQVVLGTGNAGAVGNVYVLGQQAIGGATAAGQKVVGCAATAQFKAGQKVLVTQWSGAAPDEVWTAQEIGTIASVQNNTSITLVDNLVHEYTADGFIFPCFVGVSAASGTGGTADDAVTFYPQAERRLKL